MQKRLIVGITGASGVIYGVSLIKRLMAHPVQIHLIVTRDGQKVLDHELGNGGRVMDIVRERYGTDPHPHARVLEHPPENFFAPPASGSFRHDGMAVAPCSMKTLAAIASGYADNLLTRAADACLKERRPLVLVPRETPFSRIHLENMLRVTDAGGVILPPSPGFYRRPQSIEEVVDFVTGRILDQLGVPNDLLKEWGDDDPAE
ncbi:MAG: UbiX family flavin prenyltransferase [Desulfobacterales bacterium]